MTIRRNCPLEQGIDRHGFPHAWRQSEQASDDTRRHALGTYQCEHDDRGAPSALDQFGHARAIERDARRIDRDLNSKQSTAVSGQSRAAFLTGIARHKVPPKTVGPCGQHHQGRPHSSRANNFGPVHPGDDAFGQDVGRREEQHRRRCIGSERVSGAAGLLGAIGLTRFFSAGQISLPIATAVSAMRLEKPHSLSYQVRMRHIVPSITLVWSMWNTEECGSWLKSVETSFSSV